MLKFARSQTLWLLSGALLMGSVACSSKPSAQQNSLAHTASSAPSPAVASNSPPGSSPLSSTSPADQTDAYKIAEEKANSARNLSQSALTEDDWNLVSSRWQQAIAALKLLPPSSPYQAMAKTRLSEFEKALATAKQRAKQAKANTNQSPIVSSNTQPLNVASIVTSSPGAGTVYRTPIKRRAGGTPIIDVTFNGNQTFEMIVDTGASGTVITPAMARSLGVQVVGKTKVNTASQSGVEVGLGYVNSISVAGAVVKEVVVAIGPDVLDVGLLGHDFFDSFDVTVKQDVVEFKRR